MVTVSVRCRFRWGRSCDCFMCPVHYIFIPMVRCASGIELRLIRPDLEKAELERNVVYIPESR